MSTLVVSPAPEIFSQLPLLDDVLEGFRKKEVLNLIEDVGKIFAKHNVFNKFGLSMAHRHFDMSENEILVESIKNDKTLSVFLPWVIIADQHATPVEKAQFTSYGLEDSEDKYILPKNWAFNDSGEIVPFEFLATNEKALLSVPPAEFVRELYSALKELGVEQLAGIKSIENSGGMSTWEITPDNVRANVVVHGDIPDHMTRDKMVKVMWRFDENGKINEGAETWCCS